MERISHVTVCLLDPALHGPTQIVFRLQPNDKIFIRKAAKTIGMSQTQFIRTVAVQAAIQVIDEAVKINSPIDTSRLRSIPTTRMDPSLPPGMKRGK